MLIFASLYNMTMLFKGNAIYNIFTGLFCLNNKLKNSKSNPPNNTNILNSNNRII